MYNANLLQISGVVARGADGLVVVLAKRGQVRPVDQCVVVRTLPTVVKLLMLTINISTILGTNQNC